ncbi:cell division-associated protein YmgF [Escherichia coli]|uniref:cell division-associated protein YmgF n=1 Tax=Escherichia coli TaxID=562 RepID=UPI00201CFF35|nr:cell division-associated protein YmgF [Escherichia coli]
MNNSNNLDYFTLYIIFSIAFMLITLLVILIAKPSTGLGEVLVTINLLNALVWLSTNLSVSHCQYAAEWVAGSEPLDH